jgi:hypothetical protein
MTEPPFGSAIGMWFLTAALLASAVTVAMDALDLTAMARAQLIVLWLSLLAGLAIAQGAWWTWHGVARRS